MRTRLSAWSGLALAGLLVGALATACGSDGDASGQRPGSEQQTGPGADGTTPASGVFLVYGDDVDAAVRGRITSLVGSALGKPPQEIAPDALPTSLAADALAIAIGNSSVARSVIPASDLGSLPAESYVLRSAKRGDGMLLVADGTPAKIRPHGNLGALHGAYALLEELGFAFLHPLAPTVPPTLGIPSNSIDRRDSPRWDERIIHLHTQHPLELTELLQGWGSAGPDDAAGFEAMLPEWDRFLEWCIANGENAVEWFLLTADSWKAFANSDVRVERLAKLVERAHAFGIQAGIDAPIAFAQQHSYRMLPNGGGDGDVNDELAQIDTSIDWLMRAHWDFVNIEAGTSEFTHPEPERMLAWMNEVPKYLDAHYAGTTSAIKVHCSQGQVADGYPDPITGKPINFNMLPHHADPRLGVLPHTVQHYGLTDPAPTYGNTDFGYMREFIRAEVGSRRVIWYPESAYWVSFDVDVPLFLPIYADRRLSDLRLIAADEDAGKLGLGANAGKHIDGQLVFSSGWEWGYWLNDVVAARAAWQPESGASSQEAALRSALGARFRVFGEAQNDVLDFVVDVVKAEQELLIEGRANGTAPKSISMRNGQAYLQGWETWDDVAKLAQGTPADAFAMTQPDKLGLVDMRNPLHGGPGYSAEVEPLLAAMETHFGALADRADTLRSKIPAHARDLYDDLADAMRMTALRAKQVHGLYDYVDGYWDTPDATRRARLTEARNALDSAQTIVTDREKRYRVPADRIAAWRDNPTAYEYGYLWSVRRLFYWWRDEGKAVDHPTFPCYLNVINPVDVAFGEGMGTDAVRLFGDLLSSDDQRGCLAEPTSEPTFPQDGLRTRP